MKYPQIVEVKRALEELGKERLPVAYEIARNTRLCDKIINETTDILRELFEKYADRDENGMVKQFPDEKDATRTTLRITEPKSLQMYTEEVERVLSEEHSIEFVKIPRSRIQSERLTAAMLLPLIDTVID